MACYSFPEIKSNDTLYQALVFLLQDRFRLDPGFPAKAADLEAAAADDPHLKDLSFVVATFGMLFRDNFRDPLLGKDPDPSPPAPKIQFAGRFVEQVASAVGEYQGGKKMFDRVLITLVEDGTTGTTITVFPSQVAEVSRRLREDGEDPTDAQIRLRINNVLAVVLGNGTDGRSSNIDIDLPSLDDNTTADIIAANVNALAAVYFSAQLEELKFFAVADKVTEHFMTGMLPLTRGPGGEAIYDYLKGAPNRLTELERRSLYARAFGFAQGAVDEPLPNREFQDTWIRFLSAVSQFVRLFGGANSGTKMVLQGPVTTLEQVYKAAKDLAVNISLHGYGIAHFAAVELQALVRQLKTMLSYDDVLKAYGVLDVNQMVERVSQLYLGGSVNGVQKRTMATAGANVIQWLAKNAPLLSTAPSQSLRNLILNPPSGPGSKDFDDIANNVERWLAVTGTNDVAVEKYAEPVSVPVQATIPNLSLQSMVPDSLRNVLSQVGGGLPSMPTMPMMTNGAPKA
jgi:hypothetical protein